MQTTERHPVEFKFAFPEKFVMGQPRVDGYLNVSRVVILTAEHHYFNFDK
jgi:hypothetical protein